MNWIVYYNDSREHLAINYGFKLLLLSPVLDTGLLPLNSCSMMGSGPLGFSRVYIVRSLDGFKVLRTTECTPNSDVAWKHRLRCVGVEILQVRSILVRGFAYVVLWVKKTTQTNLAEAITSLCL